MHLIAYTSTFTGPDERLQSTIEEIVSDAQTYNPTVNVTGVMFVHKRRILQILEGELSAVRGLMEKIARDSRHSQIHTLFDEPVSERGLPGWSMGFLDLDDNKEMELQDLQLMTEAYKKVLKAETAAVVDLYKTFANVKLSSE